MIAESQAAAPALRPAADRLEEAIELAGNYLLELQNAEGYWNGELEADTTLESDYILFHLWMDPPAPGRPWRPQAWERIQQAARYIRERQTTSGGWCIYPGGPDNLSASAKAYFALKLAGDDPDQPHLRAARDRIRELGGLERANSYTRIYLSFFGLYDRNRIPTIPPELILLSPGSYLNIYEISSWTRAIVVPLSILCALRPSRPVPDSFTLNELLSHEPEAAHEGIFWTLDRLLKLWERTGFVPHRQEAIRKCERWILDRLERSDGLGAIFPSMLNSILALHLLGYAADHPVLARAIRQLEDLVIREEGRLRLRPCCSPVWDTAIAAYALGRAGLRDHPGLAAAADWLLSKEVRLKGDWAVKNPHLEPGGWYFEFANEFYPDIDDTAMVLLALEYAQSPDHQAQQAAQRRGLHWVLGMQSQDGGWAAFDRDNNRQILNQVPFADHNAMLDPTCADITGRVLEALGAAGWRHHPAVARGIEYLWRAQEPDGSWAGRWGVNYLYGTCFALRGLRAAGVNFREARIIQAGEFLRSYQNADGGWGESCASYDDPGSKATGPSTASQTAWALLGLFAGGDYSTASVQRGIAYLLGTQTPDGRWEEPWFTGTGFPRVFYLKYHLYSQYFPLLALAEYRARPTRTTL
jgi:squalene-hopene/tetraprenyl-beta-curcumene cyclase